MSTHASAAELRKMQADELRKESERRRLDVAKMRLSIGMQSQKDTARFRRDKRELARMLTVLAELQSGGESELKPKRKSSTVPVPARSRKVGRRSSTTA